MLFKRGRKTEPGLRLPKCIAFELCCTGNFLVGANTELARPDKVKTARLRHRPQTHVAVAGIY